MQKYYLKPTKILVLTISMLFFGCSYFETTQPESRPLTEREVMFEQAEEFFADGEFDKARPLYSKLTRNSENQLDPLYDKALWKLSKIYEKTSESDKALLALEELYQKDSFLYPKLKIRFAQMKNHFVSENTVQAIEIKKEIDFAYKNRQFNLYDLYEFLLETSELNYRHHLSQEIQYLGEVQKYYIFIIESNLSPANENITELLIDHYEKIIAAVEKKSLSKAETKKATILLLDQLAKVNQYKLDDYIVNKRTMGAFIKFSQIQHKKLTESLYKL